MSFRANHSVSKFYVFALAALFTVVVSGCSSGGGGRDPVAMAPPAEMAALDAAEMAALDAAKMASATAAMAANDALNAAKAALDAVAGRQDDDPVHFALATDELGKAKDAKLAADAAAAAAQGADNSADAQMYQANAEAAQAAAAAARDATTGFTDAVNTAYMTAQAERDRIAAAEAEEARLALAEEARLEEARLAEEAAAKLAADLQVVRMAATAARIAAQNAANAAAMNLAALIATEDVTPQQVFAATNANYRAQNALAAATAAEADATAATALADAEAARDAALAAQADAEGDNQAIASVKMMLDDAAAAEAKRIADEAAAAEEEMTALADAKSDAMDAATAARMAADAAAANAAAGVALGDELTMRLIADAEAAAVAAEAANLKAQEAGDSAAAQGERGIAQAKQTEAETAMAAAVNASDSAVRIAGISNPSDAIAIVAARTAANEAARDARSAATAARAAAVASGSAAADMAATAADMAATAAEGAATDATSADTVMAAEEARDIAQTKEGEAQMQLTAAQTASSNAIADARFLENTRADALAGPISSAETATSAAQTAANSAKSGADAQYAKAVAARTHANDTDEDDEGSVADAVAAARAAVNAVNNAVSQVAIAKATIMNADNTQTIAAEVEKARAAMTAAATAMTNAAAALKDATAAAGEHVLALFRAANALGVTDANTATDENEAAMVRLTTIVGLFTDDEGLIETPTATNLFSDGGAAVSGVTVTYGLDTPDVEDTADKDESAPAKRAFTFEGGGGNIIMGDFMGVGETDPLATKRYLLPVGDFAGVELTKGKTIAHVYTDIEQATRETKMVQTETTASRAAVKVDADNGVSFGDLEGFAPAVDDPDTDEVDESNLNGLATFKATLTYDVNSAEVTYEGTVQCETLNECSVSREVGGPVTGLTGYHFVPNAKQTEILTMNTDTLDTDFLTFGVWLNDADSPQIGVFARGNNDNNNRFTADNIQGLGGSATYRGSAVGVYTDGSSVEHFDGTTTLTAKFGDPSVVADPDADPVVEASEGILGTIEGRVNINGGGNTPGGTLTLGKTDMTTDGPFTPGLAWKGAAKPVDARTGVSPGYAYEGQWAGQFYGNPADDATDKRPGSVAGTFGVTGTDNMGTTTGDDATDDDVTRSWIGAFGATKE